MKLNRIAQYIMMTVLCLFLCSCHAVDVNPKVPEQAAKLEEGPAKVPNRQPSASEDNESIPQLLFQRETVFDEETGIRHSEMDDQGLGIRVSFEVPVFEEISKGYQKINIFFQDLETNFFSEKNETLLFAWERAATVPHDSNYIYENYAVVYTKTEKLLSTGIYFSWCMGGVNDTGGHCYTFSPETGELLRLSALIEETEQEALDVLHSALEELENEGPELYWDEIQERSLDDFDFFIHDSSVYIDFDRYEVAEGAAGSITVLLPVTLKDLGK